MLEKVPSEEVLNKLMGEELYKAWSVINNFVEDNYVMDKLWNPGGKTGLYELKYRKSGKTFCTFYPREKGLCVLIIFGKLEREKFDNSRGDFSEDICSFYDNTHQYHDGKWLFIDVTNAAVVEDIKKMLLIKKKAKGKRAN